jgi:hypothetical protein
VHHRSKQLVLRWPVRRVRDRVTVASRVWRWCGERRVGWIIVRRPRNRVKVHRSYARASVHVGMERRCPHSVHVGRKRRCAYSVLLWPNVPKFALLRASPHAWKCLLECGALTLLGSCLRVRLGPRLCTVRRPWLRSRAGDDGLWWGRTGSLNENYGWLPTVRRVEMLPRRRWWKRHSIHVRGLRRPTARGRSAWMFDCPKRVAGIALDSTVSATAVGSGGYGSCLGCGVDGDVALLRPDWVPTRPVVARAVR